MTTTPGFTPIDNTILEAICAAELSGAECKVILVIIRKTIGWNKESDTLSFSQILQMTSLKSRSHLVNVIKELEAKRIIVALHQHGRTTTYCINKQTEEWDTSHPGNTSMQSNTSIPDNSGLVSSSIQDMYATPYRTSMLEDTHKRNLKTIKENERKDAPLSSSDFSSADKHPANHCPIGLAYRDYFLNGNMIPLDECQKAWLNLQAIEAHPLYEGAFGTKKMMDDKLEWFRKERKKDKKATFQHYISCCLGALKDYARDQQREAVA